MLVVLMVSWLPGQQLGWVVVVGTITYALSLQHVAVAAI